MVGGLIGSASSDLKGETMAFWLTRAAMLAWVAVAATAAVTGVAAAPDLPAAGSRSAAAASTVRIAPPPRPNPTVSVLVQPGEAFWYANSSGLAEIAVNAGDAARQLGLRLGAPVEVRRLP